MAGKIVGKMYKPKQIIKSNKRGYVTQCKYKSNFGGINFFDLNIELYYDDKTNEDKIVLIFDNLLVDLALIKRKNVLSKENVNLDILSKKCSIAKDVANNGLATNTFKRLISPLYKKSQNTGYIYSKNGILEMGFGIEDVETKNIVDTVAIVIYPIVINNKEYMFVDTKSNLNCLKINNSGGIYFIKIEEEIYLDKKAE